MEHYRMKTASWHLSVTCLVWCTVGIVVACSTEEPPDDASAIDSMASSADTEPETSNSDASQTSEGDVDASADGEEDAHEGIPGTSRPYCSDDGRGVLPNNIGAQCYEPIRCYWDWDWCRNVYDDWTSGDDVVCVRGCSCSGLDTSNEFSTGTVFCSIDDWGSVGSP